jgi:crotonobetainyl-CoA:carnitine CoA-transferase CaiB-like acyl-CoA transferase
VHVESPARDPGDRYRAAYAHRNKRSIALDLKSEEGHAVALRLATVADVIVENFSSGVMRRLKLDYPSLRAANPKLVFISLSGYGHTGPRSAWTSMNMNLQAYTGLMMTTGSHDDPPTAISNSWNDYIGGLHGIIAVLQALADRVETGLGRHVDLSQFECSVATLGPLLMASAVSGRPPKRSGNRSSSAAPQGVYPCAGDDEWCAVAVETDAQWSALADVVDPALGADARFTSVLGRMRHHDELDAAIAAWTRERTNVEVERQLRQAGVAAERMRRVDDVVHSPDSGGAYRPVPGERSKPILAATPPFSFSKSTIAAVGAPSKLGEHTDDVLRDWLETAVLS